MMIRTNPFLWREDVVAIIRDLIGMRLCSKINGAAGGRPVAWWRTKHTEGLPTAHQTLVVPGRGLEVRNLTTSEYSINVPKKAI